MPRRQSGDRRGNPENLVPQFSQIAQALAGVDLPQDKQGLVDYASENDADDDVISLIEELPEQEYETMADVISAAGEVVPGRDRQDDSDDED